MTAATAPNARAMAAHTHVDVGYNVQVVVAAKHKLLVEQQVTNQVFDMGLLTQTAEPAKKVLRVEPIAAVADKGSFKIEDIKACEKSGHRALRSATSARPSVRAGLFCKDELLLTIDQAQGRLGIDQELVPATAEIARRGTAGMNLSPA